MTQTKPSWMSDIDQLRRYLHQYPELSGEEHETAAFLARSLLKLEPAQLIEGIGGCGMVAVFDSGQPGPSVLFRTELDALPIQEVNDFDYRSTKENIAHKCGHDGHMAVMMGFARALYHHPPEKGRALLLFQPAEEIGAGAEWMLKDETFDQVLPIDYAVAFHNLPGFPLGTIVCKEGPFSSSVQSLIIRLNGKTSHAGEPENGINPAMAIAEIIKEADIACQPNIEEEGFAILTPVHIHMGEVAYGVSAGYGEIHLTIRTKTEEEMQALSDRLLSYAGRVSQKYGLQLDTEWTNVFRTTQNDPEVAGIIQQAAADNGLEYHAKDWAFKWGEDFGAFTQQFKGAMFGIGAGEDHPALHNPDYDFPDAITPVGIDMYRRILEHLLERTD
ncbi:amidohydrolase [Phaeodactylibacter xiamenensis]|uniref:amidohydrolase n=1 Tax=Phaeodactylibacter xiamenensis TaxID=1524460 RepID=UPI0024A98559|nr:amidohydrolase [Phaeodactylibacter xiamenensis]